MRMRQCICQVGLLVRSSVRMILSRRKSRLQMKVCWLGFGLLRRCCLFFRQCRGRRVKGWLLVRDIWRLLISNSN